MSLEGSDQSADDDAVQRVDEPPLFEDDFSSNTLSEYEISQEVIDPYMGSNGSVSYSAANYWVYIHSPNNIRMILTREDVPIPEQGHVRVEMEVLRDYHRTVNFEVWLEESGAGSLRWAAKGSAYENRIDLWADSERRMGQAERGTVDPNSGHTYTIDAYWTESSMSLYVDGEQRLAAEVDTTILDPTTFKLRNFQGDTRLKSIRVDQETAPHHEPEGTEVHASVTTLQFIPGKEENPSRGGHPLNSGLMQIFPEDGRWGVWGAAIEASTDPVFDSWMGGDMIDELPDTLKEARMAELDKYIDDTGPGREFKKYRFENGIHVSFEVDGKSIDKDTIKIKFNEAGPSGADPVIFRGDRLSSNTVLHDHSINGIPWEEWYDRKNDRPSRREPRHYEYYTDFEFQGIEGVRVVTFWGGWAGFMSDIAHRASADPSSFLGEIWDWGFVEQTLLYLAMRSAPEKVHFFLEAITTIPRTWTFLDFIVLADGRRYARVWDASQYPSLYTYVDGVLKAREDMPYETKQFWNETMFAFYARAMAGATPYSNPLKYYEMSLASETLSLEIERTINEIIDRLDLGWIASDLMPTIPRETLGFDGNASDSDTEPLDNPDEPFPLIEGTFFPLASKLPPE